MIKKYGLKYIFFLFFVLAILTQFFLARCKSRVYSVVKEFYPTAETILDVGCGSCCTTKPLEYEGKSVSYLDVVDKAKCARPKIFDGKNIPFDTNSFDLGIASFVLHHAKGNVEALLKDLQRTCKKVLILENTPSTSVEWWFAKKHSASHWGECKECFKDQNEWIKTFEGLGFRVERVKTIDPFYCPFSDWPWLYPVTCSAFLLAPV